MRSRWPWPGRSSPPLGAPHRARLCTLRLLQLVSMKSQALTHGLTAWATSRSTGNSSTFSTRLQLPAGTGRLDRSKLLLQCLGAHFSTRIQKCSLRNTVP